ncbi:MAG: hypothetical protein KGI00_04085 [Candidatus Micrarchaeota archaeon]|nr:hypothetical protein [Candidatus Micrarchaeota archaeon]MDE1824398.1 hypothetical protein [Candidatus Micrarchaeota archaeon]MDE1849879.1 hypothetical protein [Candidatus Micrarchaeota archaeon]
MDDIKELTGTFFSAFRKDIGSGRRMGLEPEFIAINKHTGLSAAPHETIKALRSAGTRLGLEPSDSGMVWSGKLSIDGIGGALRIGTDMGSGTWEISFPPSRSVAEAERMLIHVMDLLIDAADRNGIALLGMGIQPLSRPSWELVMPKKRYDTLTARHNTNNLLQKPLVDSLLNTITAASHVHFEVTPDEAVAAVNLFNAIAPEIIALSSNSGIIGGRNAATLEPREHFWDMLTKHPRDSGRNGIPERWFIGREDYVGFTSGFQPVLTKRNGDFLAFIDSASMLDFFRNGADAHFVANGHTAKLAFEQIDMNMHDSFIWFNSRLKSGTGTLEIRSASQQPTLSDTIAIAVLFKGLLEGRSSAEDVVRDRTVERARELRLSAIKNGMNDPANGAELAANAGHLLFIAAKSLERKGENSDALSPLFLRVVRRESPSDQNRVLMNGSPGKLINARKLTVQGMPA